MASTSTSLQLQPPMLEMIEWGEFFRINFSMVFKDQVNSPVSSTSSMCQGKKTQPCLPSYLQGETNRPQPPGAEQLFFRNPIVNYDDGAEEFIIFTHLEPDFSKGENT